MGMHLPPFQRLLDDHADSLLRFLSAMVGRNDADDCFQETVLSALAAYPRLRSDHNLPGWLFTIARRKAVDHYRARSRAPLPTADVPDRAAPTADVANGELWGRVRALPVRQREAVCLRYLADLAYADIARAMDCSPDAARQNVRAGLARLRKEMA
jgi:RNA polymerase sigma factor (sigma-70 family)